jgi:hypothetical protein
MRQGSASSFAAWAKADFNRKPHLQTVGDYIAISMT